MDARDLVMFLSVTIALMAQPAPVVAQQANDPFRGETSVTDGLSGGADLSGRTSMLPQEFER